MNTKNKNNFYDFSASSLLGEEISMESYKGKTILVVNTASKCGFTPQYEGLEELYQKYKNQDFVVLGFPCNQFGGQEPGSEKEIAEGCLVNFGVSFPMFSKVKVNGKDAHPLFKFLKNEKRSLLGKRIEWNFTKFLIDKNGKPIKRFSSIITPKKIEKHVFSVISEQ